MADGAGAGSPEPCFLRLSVLARASTKLTDPVYRFAGSVIALGIAAFAVVGVRGGFSPLTDPSLRLVLFMALAFGGELWLMRLPTRTSWTLISASSLFTMATLLTFGAGPALLALAVGSVVKDVRAGRPPIKLCFNAAQHVVSVALAGAVFALAGGDPGVLEAGELPAAIAAAVTFLCCNSLLTGSVVALASGNPLLLQLQQDLDSWLVVECVMLGCAPVVSVATDRSLLLLPLVMLPVLGVRHSARIAMHGDHASMHDALTGLPNRVLFRRHVDQAMERRRHTGSEVVVMIMDLDRFKEVNDTLGHGKGDELLQAIAGRLTTALPDVDVMARLGGDEFGVLLTLPQQDGPATLAVAERARQALLDPFALADLLVDAGGSLGIASAEAHGGDAETLIQRADVAMYLAKQAGTGVEFYDPARDPNAPDRLELIRDLRLGIEDDQLVLHFQPKIAVGTGAVTGFEALVRWSHPTRGLLPPGEFIAMAERTDVVRPLTLKVIESALQQVAAWHREGFDVPVAVNLSARVLLDVSLPGDIQRLLEASGVPPVQLELEITESSLIADPERTAGILERLNATGVRITIDDFGTGYSSLVLLRRLPVDAIKIDRSFVMGMETSPEDAAIVQSTVALADSLGLGVIAEGVETAAALARLGAMGCHEAQGYFICRPQPADALETWMRTAPLAPAA